jgi:hypothetical protein
MKPRSLIAGGGLAIAISLVPQSPPQAAIADSPPVCINDPYGIDGQVSEADLNTLAYLAFPQTVQDMRGRFKSPLCFTPVADYYQIEGTGNFVEVFYRGAEAMGYEIWEVQP